MTDERKNPTGQGGVEKNAQTSDTYDKYNTASGSNDQTENHSDGNPNGPPEDPIDGAKLVVEIVELSHRHLSLPDGAAVVLAFWIIHTHVFGAAEHAPRLVLTSPLPECGKSTVLKLLGQLAAKPQPTSNATPAVTFRIIERDTPTLIIDEADTFIDCRDELIGILNSGHEPWTGFVLRCHGNEHDPRKFSTYCPMAIAMIGKLPSIALESRSIQIPMQRALGEDGIERLGEKALDELAAVKVRIELWAHQNIELLKRAEPTMPPNFRGRRADNWRPLFAIADQVGGDWPKEVRSAAALLDGEIEPSRGEALLAAIREVFERRKADKLSSADLCKELASEELYFSQTTLAKALKPFGIISSSVRIGGRTPKGYKLAQFKDAFSRYLPPRSTDRDTPQ